MSARPQPTTRSEEVISRVRRLREARGLSGEALSARVTMMGHPMKRAVIAALENGQRSHMTVDELCAFAAALDVTPEGLLGATPLCARCGDEPPAGFRCLSCGSEGSR